MRVTYAHCVHAEHGKPDVAPFTRYVFRTVEAVMYRHSPHWMLGETEDTFSVEVDGTPVGFGDTKDDAAGESRYNLMDRSRTTAGFP